MPAIPPPAKLTGERSFVAIGGSGNIWYFDGSNWHNRSLENTNNLLSISFLDPLNGIITGEGGSIFATKDGGLSWEYRDVPSEASDSNITSVHYFSDIRAYAVTDEGHILRSSREGTLPVSYVWHVIEIESAGKNTSLGRELSSVHVLSQFKILLSGPENFLAMSKDGGNIVQSQIIPEPLSTDFNGFAMVTDYIGIAFGDEGRIIFTERAGEDEPIGFEILDFNDFGQFVDYSKGMLIDGLKATLKIVFLGIVFGFLIGITLALLKTSPTSLKDIVERFDVRSIKTFGVAILLLGIYLIQGTFSGIRALNLDGWEHIFVPVGDPGAFARLLVGLSISLVGALFLSWNGTFPKMGIINSEKFKLTIDPWSLRPLNSIATLYTDFFRNTPLIVQFMFIHFGIQLGKLIQEPGLQIIDGTDNFFSNALRDGILADRAYISAIFALGLNSGAYQCETIRGAVAAIPSGQMEAGRSIGLNYMQTMRLVIMPQAIRICIPPLGNEMVNLVLNSSLAMVIGYAELTRQGRLLIAVSFQIFWTWGLVMVSYFIVTWTLALILRRIESRTRIPGLGISGGA